MGDGIDTKLIDRLTRQGEETLGRIAEELVANPMVGGALSRAFEAREKAVQAQEAAMGALNLPSAADVERLTRRLRSVSQRLEGIEDSLDRLEQRATAAGSDRSAALATKLDDLAGELSALRDAVASPAKAKPRSKSAAAKAKPRSKSAAAKAKPRAKKSAAGRSKRAS